MSNLFTTRGRYNRAKYFWAEFGIFILWVVIANILEFVVSKLGGGINTAPIIFTGIFTPAVLLIAAFPIVKRLHDLGRPGSNYWLLLIPFYNIYLGFVLLFQRGDEGENKYGLDPLAGKK